MIWLEDKANQFLALLIGWPRTPILWVWVTGSWQTKADRLSAENLGGLPMASDLGKPRNFSGSPIEKKYLGIEEGISFALRADN
jgi:hypothetical protein